MSPFEEDVLCGLLEYVEAWNRFHDPQYSSMLSAEELLEAAKLAGYSEEQAQKMATERANARLDRDLPP